LRSAATALILATALGIHRTPTDPDAAELDESSPMKLPAMLSPSVSQPLASGQNQPTEVLALQSPTQPLSWGSQAVAEELAKSLWLETQED